MTEAFTGSDDPRWIALREALLTLDDEFDFGETKDGQSLAARAACEKPKKEQAGMAVILFETPYNLLVATIDLWSECADLELSAEQVCELASGFERFAQLRQYFKGILEPEDAQADG